jgi:hypothetical protein
VKLLCLLFELLNAPQLLHCFVCLKVHQRVDLCIAFDEVLFLRKLIHGLREGLFCEFSFTFRLLGVLALSVNSVHLRLLGVQIEPRNSWTNLNVVVALTVDLVLLDKHFAFVDDTDGRGAPESGLNCARP